MITQVPYRTFRWWLVVYAAFMTPLDLERLELVDVALPESTKWLFRLPIWYLPLAILAPRWGLLVLTLRRPPIAWLIGWSFFGILSMAWAINALQAAIFGLGMASLIMLSTWYVFSSGWDSFATAVAVGLTGFLATGFVVDILGGTLLTERAFGVSSGPTAQGRISALVLVLAGGIIWSRRSISLRYWLLPAVAVPALVFSETRTAMAAAVVALVYGLIGRLNMLDRAYALGSLVVLALGVFVVASALEPVAALGERGDITTVAGRTDVWPIALELIGEEPLLGYGWGSSNPLYLEAARDGRISFLAGTSHSIVLATFIQGGLIGFSLFALCVLSTFKHRKRVDPWVIAPLIVIAIGGLTESIIHLPSVSLMLIAGSMAAIAVQPRYSDTFPGIDRKRRRAPLIDRFVQGV